MVDWGPTKSGTPPGLDQALTSIWPGLGQGLDRASPGFELIIGADLFVRYKCMGVF